MRTCYSRNQFAAFSSRSEGAKLRNMKKLTLRLPSFFHQNPASKQASAAERDISLYTENDAQRNADSSPPLDECIELKYAWGVEFYTPIHIEGLIKNLHKMRQGAGHNLGTSNDPVDWLTRLRAHGTRIGRSNLGTIVPPGSATPLYTRKYFAPLPSCVEYAIGDIYLVSPSLVAVVVCFVFKDDTVNSFDDVLRKVRQTDLIPEGESLQIDFPLFQKKRHIKEIRIKVASLFSQWFSQTIPGLFSSRLLHYEMPTCEFVLLHKAEPFPSHPDKKAEYQNYLEILGMDHDYGVWESKSIEGLKYRITDLSGTSPQFHSTVAVSESNLVAGSSCGDTQAGLAKIRRVIPDLILLSSIPPMLDGYVKHLNTVSEWPEFRPRSAKGKRAKVKAFFTRERDDSPRNTLNKLRRHVAHSVDIATVTSELAIRLGKKHSILVDVESFKPCNSKAAESQLCLEKALERSIAEKAVGLQQADKSLRDHLTQYGSLVGATESVHTQSTISCLTWVLVLVGGATLVVTSLSLCMLNSTLEEDKAAGETAIVNETPVPQTIID